MMVELNIGGTKYVLKKLTWGEVKHVFNKLGLNVVSGAGDVKIDWVKLQEELLLKAIVEPKLESLDELDYETVQKLMAENMKLNPLGAKF